MHGPELTQRPVTNLDQGPGLHPARNSAWVESASKTGRIYGYVDGVARCDDGVAGAHFGTDEELTALPPVESRSNLQSFVDWDRRKIANRQLTGEGGLLQLPDDESRDVVECCGHDATVGAPRCTFKSTPQHEGGDHIVAIKAHIQLDAGRIGRPADRPVFESLSAQDGSVESVESVSHE